MGCRQTKAKGPESGILAELAVDTDDGRARQAPPDPSPTAMGKQESTSRSVKEIKSDTIRKILQLMGASKEQTDFFNVWARYVHDVAVPKAIPYGQSAFISTDLRFMEIRVTCESYLMAQLLGDFRDGVKIPPTMFNQMRIVLDSLQAKESLTGEAVLTVWAKFKYCRSESPPPSVDFGFFVNQDLQWSVIDVMMYSTDDQDLLREFAQTESHDPILYGSSLCPTEPEKQLGFEFSESATSNHRQILISAFFFFKTFGLMKPEDRIVKILNSCGSRKLVVIPCIGPKGLVRLTLTLTTLSSPLRLTPEKKPSQAAKELCEEIGFTYKDEMQKIMTFFDGEPDILEYVAESPGYSIRFGFTV